MANRWTSPGSPGSLQEVHVWDALTIHNHPNPHNPHTLWSIFLSTSITWRGRPWPRTPQVPFDGLQRRQGRLHRLRRL